MILNPGSVSHIALQSSPPLLSGLATRIHEFEDRKSRLAVIIPILNQGDVILTQLQRMQKANLKLDIVLCDGDSSDGSTNVSRLQSLGVRTLLVTNQAGLGTALRLGFSYAMDEGYEGVITIDGNGKDGIDAIALFEDRLSRGFDFVQGSRFMLEGVHANTPWDRYIGIRLFLAPLMGFASGFWYSDPTNGFKGLSRKFILDERLQPLRAVFQQFNLQFYLNYMAPKLGYTVVEIPVSRVYPKGTLTPTKIIGTRIKWILLCQFFGVILGRYAVRKSRTP
jgi:dolichol-phosphate mannosyltransferase